MPGPALGTGEYSGGQNHTIPCLPLSESLPGEEGALCGEGEAKGWAEAKPSGPSWGGGRVQRSVKGRPDSPGTGARQPSTGRAGFHASPPTALEVPPYASYLIQNNGPHVLSLLKSQLRWPVTLLRALLPETVMAAYLAGPEETGSQPVIHRSL